MKVIITGAAGQDGRLLGSLLSEHGYTLLGIDRAFDGTWPGRTVCCDVADHATMDRLIAEFQPDEIYHLAACHHSAEGSTDLELETQMLSTNFLSTRIVIASMLNHVPRCRLLIACSSQMYAARYAGDTVDEGTHPSPTTFYGLTKKWSWDLVKYARSTYGTYACAAILFNHESPLRGRQFVTRKIAAAAARASISEETNLTLQDIEAESDWSSARDIVAGMKTILGASDPGDFVLASGALHSVSDVLEVAFERVGLDWRAFVEAPSNARSRRPSLVGDASKAKRELDWQPSVSFRTMIEEMVDQDLALLGANSPAR